MKIVKNPMIDLLEFYLKKRDKMSEQERMIILDLFKTLNTPLIKIKGD